MVIVPCLCLANLMAYIWQIIPIMHPVPSPGVFVGVGDVLYTQTVSKHYPNFPTKTLRISNKALKFK